jgi:hypothetical protein
MIPLHYYHSTHTLQDTFDLAAVVFFDRSIGYIWLQKMRERIL